MRRKLLIMLSVVLTLALGVVLLIAGTLTLPILRENTWCVLPVIVISGLGMGHVVLLLFTPSTSSKKKRRKQSAQVVAAGSTPVAAAAAPGATVALAESEDAAQKTVFQTVVGCCSPSRLERAWYIKMRSEFFNRKTFAACLGLVVMVDILLPLLITGKSSFGEAKVFQLSRCAHLFARTPSFFLLLFWHYIFCSQFFLQYHLYLCFCPCIAGNSLPRWHRTFQPFSPKAAIRKL